MHSICTRAPSNIRSECMTWNEIKMKMFVKGISTEDFPKNCLGGTSNRSLRMRTMAVSENYPAIHLEG